MSKVTAVVPTSVVKTGTFNWVFIAQAELDYRGEPYGFLFFEDGQWRVLVIKEANIVVGGNTTTQTVIALDRDDLPDFIVLVEPEDFESAKRLLEGAGHTVTEHPYKKGALATFGRA